MKTILIKRKINKKRNKRKNRLEEEEELLKIKLKRNKFLKKNKKSKKKSKKRKNHKIVGFNRKNQRKRIKIRHKAMRLLVEVVVVVVEKIKRINLKKRNFKLIRRKMIKVMIGD
jgi:hypothetical protein